MPRPARLGPGRVIGISSGIRPAILPVNVVPHCRDVVFRSVSDSKRQAALANAVVAFQADQLVWPPEPSWSVRVCSRVEVVIDPKFGESSTASPPARGPQRASPLSCLYPDHRDNRPLSPSHPTSTIGRAHNTQASLAPTPLAVNRAGSGVGRTVYDRIRPGRSSTCQRLCDPSGRRVLMLDTPVPRI